MSDIDQHNYENAESSLSNLRKHDSFEDIKDDQNHKKIKDHLRHACEIADGISSLWREGILLWIT